MSGKCSLMNNGFVPGKLIISYKEKREVKIYVM